ncbi:MG(2+) CHELATASE FAMILY PROTEIN / ComM-related protein [hydrothermal vent metagenome]|uniref:MG(2+) CHELATASE FAMILY PROTEIN / ComM-related protein n=1 Tax=hydrothermal vent metagenome TaxID=652676 RepID=A0A3B0R4C8_9ZZZZ
MTAHISTVAFHGVEAVPVDVQVQISSGVVAFTIVGLPDKAVAESRERVSAALRSVGLALPARRITVNMAPADLPKEGSHYDLPIALGLLSAMGVLPHDYLAQYYVIGELGLDGSVAAISGALPAAMAANSAGRGLICPGLCGSEAVWAGEDVDVLAADNLIQIVNHFKGTQVLSRPEPGLETETPILSDLVDIKGQEAGKRALEVAAAGGHHLLMVGPPGAGKSMLANRLPSILPAMTAKEMLEVSMIASVSGDIRNGALSARRPFRAPHHSASQAALVGGGMKAKPGEMALAHNGVLFLDEFPEFQSRALEALRQPLESGQTVIARANHHVTYPANFQLIAAMNPCKCGMAGEPGHVCKRGPRCASDYQGRISGPLLDRMDIQIELPAVRASDLTLPTPKETSEDVAKRVARAREIQRQRFTDLGLEHLRSNAQADGRLLEEIARTDDAGQSLMSDAAEAMNLSARGYHRVLRVARTLADLANRPDVSRVDIAEAISYRQQLASFSLAA